MTASYVHSNFPILPKEGSDGSHKFSEIFDESPVEVGEAKEHINVVWRFGSWPQGDLVYFGGVHPNSLGSNQGNATSSTWNRQLLGLRHNLALRNFSKTLRT
jgi:hypothetical protein